MAANPQTKTQDQTSSAMLRRRLQTPAMPRPRHGMESKPRPRAETTTTIVTQERSFQWPPPFSQTWLSIQSPRSATTCTTAFISNWTTVTWSLSLRPCLTLSKVSPSALPTSTQATQIVESCTLSTVATGKNILARFQSVALTLIYPVSKGDHISAPPIVSARRRRRCLPSDIGGRNVTC